VSAPINQKVEQLVKLLFEDKLIAGLQVVQKGTWHHAGESSFNALTGEVTQDSTNTEEVSLVLLPYEQQGSEAPGGNNFGKTQELITSRSTLKFVMRPLEKTMMEALHDQLHFGSALYSVAQVQEVWLGQKVVLWQVEVR
jgi:hypothetical protein